MLRPLLLLLALLPALPARAQDAPPTAPPTAAPPDAALPGAAPPALGPTPSSVARPASMYADLRAFSVGDLVTIVLAERTAARRTSSSSTDSYAAFGGGAQAPSALGGAFGLDAHFSQARDADSRTVQSDLLSGTITARVVAVDGAGNLRIEGERRLQVDGATHVMTVSGTVRPVDLGRSNTVLSHQIAGADVVYRQEGGGPSFLRSRFLTGLGTVAVLVGAIVFGAAAAGTASATAGAAQ